MGSLAQICSGVGRSSEGFGGFRKVPEGSARFRYVLAQVPEVAGKLSGRFSGRLFGRFPKCAGAGAGARSGGRFWRVSEGAGGFQKVPEYWRRWQAKTYPCTTLKLRKPIYIALLYIHSCYLGYHRSFFFPNIKQIRVKIFKKNWEFIFRLYWGLLPKSSQ